MHDEFITAPLTQGKFALISPEDEHLLRWRWCVVAGGKYAGRNRQLSDGPGSGIIYMHRQILNAPEGISVDHVNHDSLDNRRRNLRLATQSQNMANGLIQRNNTSGYRGVIWLKRERLWLARIKVNRQQRNLGYFKTPEEAARCYDAEARSVWGEFAYQNFP